MNFGTRGFLGSLTTNLSSIFRKFRMADPIWLSKIAKSYLIGMKFGTRGFLAPVITNPSSTLRNYKCQMQYGGPKCKKQKVMPQRNLHGITFFRSLIMNLTLDFWNQYDVCKMMAENLQNYPILLKICMQKFLRIWPLILVFRNSGSI